MARRDAGYRPGEHRPALPADLRAPARGDPRRDAARVDPPAARADHGRAPRGQPQHRRPCLPRAGRRRADRAAGRLGLAGRARSCAAASPSAPPASRGGSRCRRGGSASSPTSWANWPPNPSAGRISFVQGVAPDEPSPLAGAGEVVRRASRAIRDSCSRTATPKVTNRCARRLRARMNAPRRATDRAAQHHHPHRLDTRHRDRRPEPGRAGRRDHRRIALLSGRAASLSDQRPARDPRAGRRRRDARRPRRGDPAHAAPALHLHDAVAAQSRPTRR